MEQDIRILELNKQHYFDRYGQPLKCDYSCWGYYDGINVSKAPVVESKLFKKRTKAPVSPIWFGMGRNIEQLNGNYSKQNIGIFRCADKDDMHGRDFWEGKYSNMPYFAVGFIHIEENTRYSEIAKKLEELSGETCVNDVIVYRSVISYFTFDNVEIVALVKSNSLLELGKILNEIKEREEISYIHTIVGVSERYLSDCYTAQFVLPEWKSIVCNIEEKIPDVYTKVVTSGKKNIAGEMKWLLEKQFTEFGFKGFDKITFSGMAGHGDFLLHFSKSDVKSVLGMLLHMGFSTHQNPLYGDGIYNMETELCFSTERIDEIKAVYVMERETDEKRWCEVLIHKYVKKMKKAIEDEHDEGLYSYYRALVQTLNTLTQYEGFSLSANIFLLLWPVFDMFDRHLGIALDETNDLESKDGIEKVKNSICEFLTAVNSIIYHTVHTDQVFLMVPGYSGTSYSIPIKLCLLYLGIADWIVKLMNEEGYEYRFMVSPEMEARPISTTIDMGINKNDRLIRFCSSQRSLYMPRHFILILTHEVAHYVGADIRNRKQRSEKIIKALSFAITDGLIPDGKPLGIDYEVYNEICAKLKENLKNDCKNYLLSEVEADSNPQKYHGNELKRILYGACQRYLADIENGAGKILFRIPEKFINNVRECDLIDLSDKIYAIQKWMDNNRNALLASNIMENFFDAILQLYREIFSDVAAILILDCDEETYIEAFDVSEGVADQKDNKRTMARERIVHKLFFDSNKSQEAEPQEAEPQEVDEDWPKKYFDNLYAYAWIEKYLLDYAEECKNKIKTRIEKEEFCEYRDKIRSLFQLFCKDQATCGDIYSAVMECINNYMRQVKQEYQACKDELEKKE